MLYPNKYKYKTKSVYSLANGAFGMKVLHHNIQFKLEYSTRYHAQHKTV